MSRLSVFVNRARESARRFPCTLGALVVNALWLARVTQVSGAVSSVDRQVSAFLFLLVWAVLALELWGEFKHSRAKWTAAVLLIGVPVVVVSLWAGRTISHIFWPVVGVAWLALLIFGGTLCLIHRREADDLTLWNFLKRTAVGACLATVAGGVLSLSLVFLYEVVQAFFSVPEYECVYDYILILAWGLVAPMTWLQSFPRLTAPDRSDGGLGRVSAGVVKWVLLPVVLLYAAVLHVYVLKIVFQWSLPQGMVSVPVGVLVMLAMVFLGLTYPMQFTVSGFVVRVRRWLPYALIVPLLLMSVGLGRRVGDYGWTPWRVLLLAFNAWAILALAYLLLRPRAKFSALPVTFVLIAACCLSGPQNISDLMSRQRISRAESIVPRLEAAEVQTAISPVLLLGDTLERGAQSYVDIRSYDLLVQWTSADEGMLLTQSGDTLMLGFPSGEQFRFLAGQLSPLDGRSSKQVMFYYQGAKLIVTRAVLQSEEPLLEGLLLTK